MEADLRRFYGVRLTGLWRGELSLRELWVLVEHLPPGSAVWCLRNGVPYGWSLTDVLLADLFHAFTGSPHPVRPAGPAPARDDAARIAALRAQRERLHAQR